MTPQELRDDTQAWLAAVRELMTYRLNEFLDPKVEAGLLDAKVADEFKADFQRQLDDVQKRCSTLAEFGAAMLGEENAADDIESEPQ